MSQFQPPFDPSVLARAYIESKKDKWNRMSESVGSLANLITYAMEQAQKYKAAQGKAQKESQQKSFETLFGAGAPAEVAQAYAQSPETFLSAKQQYGQRPAFSGMQTQQESFQGISGSLIERYNTWEQNRQRQQQSLTGLREAQAGMMAGGEEGGAPEPTIITDKEGRQILAYPTPQGYRYRELTPTPISVNPITGEQTALPRGARMYVPPGAAKGQETLTKIDGLEASLGMVEDLYKTIPSGRISGNTAKVLNKFTGLYPEVRTAETAGGILVPMVTRVIGGDVGNLNEQEQKAAKQALLLADGTKQERAQAFGILKSLISDKRRQANLMIQGKTGTSLNLKKTSPKSANQRFLELKNSGLSKPQIYEKMRQEGF